MKFSFKDLQRVRDHLKKVLEANNYIGLYTYMPDSVRFWDFSKRYKSMSRDVAREIFKQIYEHIDFVSNICRNLDKEMVDYIKEDNRGNDYKIIYRGVGQESADIEQAISWTTDLGTALFFACRQSDSRVYKAKVKECNILMELDNRNEKEVLVKFEDLEDLEEMDFIPGDMINVVKYLPIFEEFNAFYKTVQKAVGKKCLYSDNGGIHGLSHAERVTWLCCTIVDELVANTKGNPGFEPRDTIKLMLAALFHDCGRINDNDEKHGVLGSKKVRNNKDRICKAFNLSDREFNEILILIEMHDTDKEYVEDTSIGRLLSILKDADALDRYRLDQYRTEFDYNMLRLEESKRLVLLSAFIYNNKIVKQIKEYF
jgi:hypothetical protein